MTPTGFPPSDASSPGTPPPSAPPPNATPPSAAVADAAVRLAVDVRAAPAELLPVISGAPFAGPAAPVTHLGSVDVLLEAIDDASPGEVLVIDNGGRHDEACVGDLIALEAHRAGIAGIVIWGRHRDHAELQRLGLPVHSLGAYPFGPRRVPPPGPAMRVAMLDGARVDAGDLIAGDDDGVLVVPASHAAAVLAEAGRIQSTEAAQAERMRRGETLRSQLDFAGYRARQRDDPTLTLRRHLAERGGAVET